MEIMNIYIGREVKMFRKIEGNSYNSPIKQFWCKRCCKSTNIIYKDENGNTYCDLCIENSEKSLSVIEENVVEEEVEILETEEITSIPPRKTVKINKKAKVANVVRRERKLF